MNLLGPSDIHGAASWASFGQMKAAGMTNPAGLILGHHKEQRIHHTGDGHILTVAPPGSGKTAALVIPNLLHYSGSVVVTDPKGALTAMTARHRRENLRQRVVVLNPWHREMTAALGQDLGDTGFNPLSILRDDASLHDNAKLIGNLLIPDRPDEKDPYWNQAARSILIGCLLLLVKDRRRSASLPALASMVRDTPEGWHDIAGAMIDHGGLLTDYAAEILTPLKSDRQWSGVHGKMLAATDLYRTGDPLGEHVSRDEFDPADLKQQAVTVYIVIPSNRREANKSWLGLVMALFAEAIGRPGPSREVLLLAEEFANLGYMPTIARAMAEYREAGLKVWLIVQNLKQLARIYGQDGENEITNLCETKQFFAVDDYDTARELSQAVGQKTVEVTSRTHTYSETGAPSASKSETGVPLIRPEDIMKLPKEQAIVLRQGEIPPLLLTLQPYYADGTLQHMAMANPYRQNMPQVHTQTTQNVDHTDETPSLIDWLGNLPFMVLLLLSGGGVYVCHRFLIGAPILDWWLVQFALMLLTFFVFGVTLHRLSNFHSWLAFLSPRTWMLAIPLHGWAAVIAAVGLAVIGFTQTEFHKMVIVCFVAVICYIKGITTLERPE